MSILLSTNINSKRYQWITLQTTLWTSFTDFSPSKLESIDHFNSKDDTFKNWQ